MTEKELYVMAENGRPLNFSFTKLQYLAIVNRQDETGAAKRDR